MDGGTFMIRILRLAIFMWMACLITSPVLLAQQLRISGTIDDTTGVIPGATVTLRDPSGAGTQTTTDATGQ
jgi:hypothetical protein